MRYLYVLFSVVTFAGLFLVFFPLFILFRFFGAGGRKAIWRIIQIWSYIWFFLICMPVRKIYLGKPDRKKQYVVIGNHRSYLDTAMIFRSIPFYARPLAKYELSKIPLFGFLYRSMAIVVNRNDTESKLKSLRLLKRTLVEERASIFIFPEGTFNETDHPLKSFYDGAFRVALQTKTPILPVVFPDTIKRWHYSGFWRWSPGICRAIFLPEVSVEGLKTDDLPALKEQVYKAMWKALAEAD